MFLNNLVKSNKSFIDATFYLAKQNLIEPNSYVIDLETTYKNMQSIVKEAEKHGVNLFFVPKHIGFNPFLAQKAVEFGFKGIMPVDFVEAQVMHKNDVKIAHLGHLVQCPNKMLEGFMQKGVGIITVYSLEKAQAINETAKKLGIVQDIMLKPLDATKDTIYPQQESGVELDLFENFVKEVKKLEYVKINGITSFPCFLFDRENNSVAVTNNIKTIHKANAILKAHDVNVNQINLPSVACKSTINLVKKQGGNYAEVGNGATGTTPLHALENNKQEEKQSLLYYSSVSHSLKDKSCIYGGGYYRRSHLANVLTSDYKTHKVCKQDSESIDYHIGLKSKLKIETPVIACFRTQIFTTRAKVVLVDKISTGKPIVKAVYTALGERIK